jgi:hypothetical protein
VFDPVLVDRETLKPITPETAILAAGPAAGPTLRQWVERMRARVGGNGEQPDGDLP